MYVYFLECICDNVTSFTIKLTSENQSKKPNLLSSRERQVLLDLKPS